MTFASPQVENDTSSSHEDETEYYMDLAEILKQEIENEEYICLICTGEIGISSKVWSCRKCYRVYDLECIKGWSKHEIKQSLSAGKGHQWRCPSCNNLSTAEIQQYRCWCNKETEPVYNGLMPHSCGQTCGAQLPGCIHKCSSMCHPGPHVDCTAMGPSMSCLCGKEARQWPCIITRYSETWQCHNICNEMMPCGKHRCSRKCHSGLCGKCTQEISVRCYCGKHVSSIVCDDQRPKLSKTAENEWIGYFACHEPCNEVLVCGNHKCESICHSRSCGDHQCSKAPPKQSAKETCHCGKTLVKDILGRERESCLEAVPVCNKSCGKIGSCGHECLSECHEGPCPPCRRLVTVHCRCGNQIFDVPCLFKTSGDEATCTRKCTALMDCRRHECGQICCRFQKQARERERTKKKNRRGIQYSDNDELPRREDEIIEQVHTCERVCNRLLNCGLHRCVMTCHKGPCHPCLESSLEDWKCPCGQTVVPAPIRCGREMPKCPFPCTRPKPCGHPLVDHECHDDNQPCPPCVHLMERQCTCTKTIVKGVLCSVPRVSCGRACGLLLKCGHRCPLICHEKGKCATKCTSICGRTRSCNHLDKGPCHGVSTQSCEDVNGPCMEMVTVECSCGNLRENLQCTGQEKQVQLDCDSSCAILERNRRLAEALSLDLTNKAVIGSQEHLYDSVLLDIYNGDKAFGNEIERQMIEFIEDGSKSIFRFDPMKSHKRQFIHMLAVEFGLQSISQDREPNRNVQLLRTESCKIPWNRLADSLHQ